MPTDVPSDLSYKEQGDTLEEVLDTRRHGLDLPSDIGYKEQADTLSQVWIRRQQQQQQQDDTSSSDNDFDENIFPSDIDYKEQGDDPSQVWNIRQRRRHDVATLVAHPVLSHQFGDDTIVPIAGAYPIASDALLASRGEDGFLDGDEDHDDDIMDMFNEILE